MNRSRPSTERRKRLASASNGRATKTLGAAALVAALIVSAGGRAMAQVTPDLVSRKFFRVCSDPANLPFSNRKQQGFENKIADIFGDALKRPVHYFWAPSGPGFMRNTLNDDLCDVVMGYTVGAEMVLSTNPYYRSTYVIVAPKGSALNGIESLDDPRLKNHRLGVFAATSPVDVMLSEGLLTGAQVYPLLVDHRFDSPLNVILDDLAQKRIDAAIVWGPLIGKAVKDTGGALVMTPLLKDVDKAGFAYRISLGVRHDETEWKHQVETILRTRKEDITKVLVEYNVPLIDNAGHLITPPQTAPAPTGFKMPGPAPTNQ